MSQPNLGSVNVPTVLTKKPQMNVYTVILLLSLLALLTACIFFALEWKAYDLDSGTSASVSAPTFDANLAPSPNLWA
jgi:hypothetical protein